MVTNMKLMQLLGVVKNTIYTLDIHEQGSNTNIIDSSSGVMDNIKALEKHYNREVVAVSTDAYGNLEIVIAKE